LIILMDVGARPLCKAAPAAFERIAWEFGSE
jgi:hypothetical protein